jgi:membrane protein DedA with SNARE-associated domain
MLTGPIAELIAAHGYPLIVIVIALESMGVPLPGETTLITAAIYAGTTHGLHIGPVIASAAAGAIAGDTAGYWIGRGFGHALITHRSTRHWLTSERLSVGQYLFDRHGGAVVFFGRFMALLRTLAALLAGVNRMPWRRFLLFNAAGGFTWATVFGLGGYLLGQRMERLHGLLAVVGIAAAVVGIAVVTIVTRRQEARLVARARRRFVDGDTRPTTEPPSPDDVPKR